jgi:hypothetical protein
MRQRIGESLENKLYDRMTMSTPLEEKETTLIDHPISPYHPINRDNDVALHITDTHTSNHTWYHSNVFLSRISAYVLGN